jgi:hypothetical protein
VLTSTQFPALGLHNSNGIRHLSFCILVSKIFSYEKDGKEVARLPKEEEAESV